MVLINILFFMAAASVMAGYASTELERIRTWRFVLKVLASALLIVMFMKYWTEYGHKGLLMFVAAAICMLAV